MILYLIERTSCEVIENTKKVYSGSYLFFGDSSIRPQILIWKFKRFEWSKNKPNQDQDLES